MGEKAFQKQDAVFIGSKRLLGKKTNKKSMRYWRTVGLGFATPKEAKEGNYVDKKCPFTGNVSIRGKILKGMVVSTKMKRTIIIRRNYLHYIKKFNRFEKRHSNMAVHCSPCFEPQGGRHRDGRPVPPPLEDRALQRLAHSFFCRTCKRPRTEGVRRV